MRSDKDTGSEGSVGVGAGVGLTLSLLSVLFLSLPRATKSACTAMEEMDDLASFRPRSQTWPCKPSTFESYDGDGTSLISPADVNNATINSSANLSSNDSAIGLSSELNNAINITSAPVSTSPSSASSANSTSNANAQLTSSAKRSNSRRNAWGSASYADLITQAINNSPDKRLTLSQIYEWMVQNVPYFKDKGDSNSSAGWKVSIYSHPFTSLSLALKGGLHLAHLVTGLPGVA